MPLCHAFIIVGKIDIDARHARLALDADAMPDAAYDIHYTNARRYVIDYV